MWLLFPLICLVAINLSASPLARFPCNDNYYVPTITVNSFSVGQNPECNCCITTPIKWSVFSLSSAEQKRLHNVITSSNQDRGISDKNTKEITGIITENCCKESTKE
jgi:hypothetical protein